MRGGITEVKVYDVEIWAILEGTGGKHFGLGRILKGARYGVCALLCPSGCRPTCIFSGRVLHGGLYVARLVVVAGGWTLVSSPPVAGCARVRWRGGVLYCSERDGCK